MCLHRRTSAVVEGAAAVGGAVEVARTLLDETATNSSIEYFQQTAVFASDGLLSEVWHRAETHQMCSTSVARNLLVSLTCCTAVGARTAKQLL